MEDDKEVTNSVKVETKYEAGSCIVEATCCWVLYETEAETKPKAELVYHEEQRK